MRQTIGNVNLHNEKELHSHTKNSKYNDPIISEYTV